MLKIILSYTVQKSKPVKKHSQEESVSRTPVTRRIRHRAQHSTPRWHVTPGQAIRTLLWGTFVPLALGASCAAIAPLHYGTLRTAPILCVGPWNNPYPATGFQVECRWLRGKSLTDYGFRGEVPATRYQSVGRSRDGVGSKGLYESKATVRNQRPTPWTPPSAATNGSGVTPPWM